VGSIPIARSRIQSLPSETKDPLLHEENLQGGALSACAGLRRTAGNGCSTEPSQLLLPPTGRVQKYGKGISVGVI
jgi:hypothetical protein